MHKIAGFCIYNLKIFPGWATPKASPVLGPRHQFPLGSPAFPLFLVYETTPTPVCSFVRCIELDTKCGTEFYLGDDCVAGHVILRRQTLSLLAWSSIRIIPVFLVVAVRAVLVVNLDDGIHKVFRGLLDLRRALQGQFVTVHQHLVQLDDRVGKLLHEDSDAICSSHAPKKSDTDEEQLQLVWGQSLSAPASRGRWALVETVTAVEY